MRYARIGQSLLFKLAVVLIILAMFKLARSAFETAVIAGLVLVYVTVRVESDELWRSFQQKWILDSRRYILLARASEIDTEEDEKGLRKSVEIDAIDEELLKVNAIFNVILACFAVGKLVYAL